VPGKDDIGVTLEVFAERFPTLWHMAEADSLDSIRRHGLLSTQALLDLFEVTGRRRVEIESQRRPESVTITHPIHGKATIRDNRPMYDAVLRKTLVGFSVDGWYSLLNSKVFFWCSLTRLDRLRQAKAYRESKHLILEVDSAALLRRHANEVELSTMNSGATHPGAQYPRGTATFAPLARYRWAERLRTHRSEPAVEFTVKYAVPDIMDFVLRHWIE
jgi:hypothetical protein